MNKTALTPDHLKHVNLDLGLFIYLAKIDIAHFQTQQAGDQPPNQEPAGLEQRVVMRPL